MPSSFAHGANARSLTESQSAPPVELKVRRPRVLIFAPASLTLSEARALRYGIEDLQCSVTLFRTDDDFRLKEVREEIHDLHNPFSHLLLVLGQLNSFDDTILMEADAAKIPNIALFALHSRDALDRHAAKIEHQERFKLLIVRTPVEHAYVQNRWRGRQSLMAHMIAEDAARIGELLVGKPVQKSVVMQD